MIVSLLRRWRRGARDAPAIDRRVPAVHYVLRGTYGPLLVGRLAEVACIWNGFRFVSNERDALHAIARVLVEAGAPDGTWALIDHVPHLLIRGESLHSLAAEGQHMPSGDNR